MWQFKEGSQLMCDTCDGSVVLQCGQMVLSTLKKGHKPETSVFLRNFSDAFDIHLINQTTDSHYLMFPFSPLFLMKGDQLE